MKNICIENKKNKSKIWLGKINFRTQNTLILISSCWHWIKNEPVCIQIFKTVKVLCKITLIISSSYYQRWDLHNNVVQKYFKYEIPFENAPLRVFRSISAFIWLVIYTKKIQISFSHKLSIWFYWIITQWVIQITRYFLNYTNELLLVLILFLRYWS